MLPGKLHSRQKNKDDTVITINPLDNLAIDKADHLLTILLPHLSCHVN